MAKNEKFDAEDGVWRTIGGRRVFIRNGQSLSDAMKESGKYKSAKKQETEEEKERTLEQAKAELGWGHHNLTKQEEVEKRFSAKEEQEKSWRDKLKDKNSRDEIINKELDESTKGKIKDYYKKEDANTNYRDKITDVAKNSKEDNVTLDVETGKPVNFDKGYSVSFQQSTDNYTDEEYAEKVAECRDKCDGKVYAGKYGGDAEASFHTDNLDDAVELMHKYNQESIYDWQHGTLIMNDKYDASKNQTNYKEKSTNDYMNEKIRKGASKNKVKEDLPKKTEIKTQGTSNRKEVSENIQAHILDYYDSPEDFIQQMDAMDYLPTKWHAGEELAKGGNYMVYYDEQREFLDGLKINPKGKEFSDDRVFQTYTSLIGRESAKLYDRLKKNAYKKYMKQHPESKMSFSEYKDMTKGGE